MNLVLKQILPYLWALSSGKQAQAVLVTGPGVVLTFRGLGSSKSKDLVLERPAGSRGLSFLFCGSLSAFYHSYGHM